MFSIYRSFFRKKPPYLITGCTFEGDPPAPFESWGDYWEHAFATKVIAGITVRAATGTGASRNGR